MGFYIASHDKFHDKDTLIFSTEKKLMSWDAVLQKIQKPQSRGDYYIQQPILGDLHVVLKFITV